MVNRAPTVQTLAAIFFERNEYAAAPFNNVPHTDRFTAGPDSVNLIGAASRLFPTRAASSMP
jgi:hypothetical protein